MGNKLRIRLLVAVVLAALMATISAAPTAGADTPSNAAQQAAQQKAALQKVAAAATTHTLSQALAYLPGKKSSGPNAYTKQQWVVITAMVQTKNSKGCPTGNYAPKLALHDNRTLTGTGTAAAGITPAGTATGDVAVGPCPQVTPDGGVQLNTARPNLGIDLNPFNWDWGHILGSTWSAIWDNCLSGATSSLVGSVGTSLAVNLLSRGARMTVGLQGYAAVAIGGCFANLLW